MVDGKKDSGLYYSKEYKFNAILVQRLNNFLGMFNRHEGQVGCWSAEDKIAYNVVMKEVNGGDMNSEKLAQYLSKKLDVSYRQIKRERLLRQDMKDMDKKGWICVNRKMPADYIKEGKTILVWKYDTLLCIVFTFQYHIHVLIYLLHYFPSFYFINRSPSDNIRSPAY